jgi:hypothetical protein
MSEIDFYKRLNRLEKDEKVLTLHTMLLIV